MTIPGSLDREDRADYQDHSQSKSAPIRLRQKGNRAGERTGISYVNDYVRFLYAGEPETCLECGRDLLYVTWGDIRMLRCSRYTNGNEHEFYRWRQEDEDEFLSGDSRRTQ